MWRPSRNATRQATIWIIVMTILTAFYGCVTLEWMSQEPEPTVDAIDG